MAKLFYVILLSTTLLLSACGSGSGSSSGSEDSKFVPKNRIDWEHVPAIYNPETTDIRFNIDGIEKVNLAVFGFTDDVEVIYSKDVTSTEGYLRLYSVWYKQASLGGVKPYVEGKKVNIWATGDYDCSIRTSNSRIVALEGGCYVRMQVYLPVGAQVEVYNVDNLITKRFFPISNADFLEEIDHTSWDKDKLVVIDKFINSYATLSKTPSLTTLELKNVLHDFIRSEEKLSALSKLHTAVSDRENLSKMLDDEFDFAEREQARKITGL